MEKQLKMNTLLAKVDHSASVFTKEVNEYTNYFKKNQGSFRGEKKTYTAREGYPDDASKRGNTSVQTTVDEQLEWFDNIAKQYLVDLFKVESTNSTGARKVALIVDGHDFGDLTALDLMRLKNILTATNLNDMYNHIPVRSDSENWMETDAEEYTGRAILETEMVKGVSRTTESEEVILKDPNVDPQHLPANYRPAVVTKRKTVEIGDYTHQRYTGEWSQRQKAELLNRKSKLLKAVIAALKEVNDVPVEQENLQVDNFINYLHYGK